MYQERKECDFLPKLAQILSKFEDNELIEANIVNGVLVLLIGGNEQSRDELKKAIAPLNE